MQDYKSLSKYEKLKYIQESRVCSSDRKMFALYLKALWLNDKKGIEEFESFGSTPRSMAMNKNHYNRQLLFGFKELVWGNYGWLERPTLLDQEVIEFKDKSERFSSNSVSIGRGENGIWVYDKSFSTGNSGGCSKASIWSKMVDTKEEAVINGLMELIKGHNDNRERLFNKDSCGNYKESYSRAIVKMAQEELDKRTGKIAVQLSFF